METSHTQTFCRCFCAHNFRLLLRHFFFGQKNLLSFLNPVGERCVSQELFNELRTVQIVLRFPRVLCTVGQRGWEGVESINHFTQTFANMEVPRPTHSVKPFHFRKYSTLPSRTLRRMILSTANSWTTAVSSVFLCLAVCFFLILPSTTRTRIMSTGKTCCERSVKRDNGAANKRVFSCSCARRGTWKRGSETMIRAHTPHSHLLFRSPHPHAFQRVHMHGRIRFTRQYKRASCANNRK